MERFDVSEGHRLSDVVAAAERGEDVVIVRNGAVVAEVEGKSPVVTDAKTKPRKFDLAALEELHRQFPIRVIGISADIQQCVTRTTVEFVF